MDPFSITVGAVSLVDAANKVTTALIDRYQAFHSAPKQMQEIADQITLCAGLVDVFAKSVDGSGIGVREFPEKFVRDATGLVGQCRGILNEIEKMIPRGSQKPGYTERLKFAFGDEKKILKQQEKLKQVQHMLMFMTTCWMYQLPSMPKPEVQSSSTTNIPAGNFTGFMQHMPLQINIKDPNASAESTGYEATLTLKPIERQAVAYAALAKKKTEKKESRSRLRSDAKQTRNEKQVLENMRRSPYFSTSVLSQPIVLETASYTEFTGSPEVDRVKWEVAGRREEETRKQKLSHEERPEVVVRADEYLSSEQAAVGVDSFLSEWFHTDDADLSDIEIYHTPSQSPNISHRPSKKSPSPKPPTIEVVTVEPASSSSYISRPPSPIPVASLHPSSSGRRPPNVNKSIASGRRHSNPDRPQSSHDTSVLRRTRSWDWKCDGCKLGYFYTDPRYKCMNCSDFDFCPHCYNSIWHRDFGHEGVWHRHPKSSFRREA